MGFGNPYTKFSFLLKSDFNRIKSGDPGKPYRIDKSGKKVSTGASLFYILSAICVNSQKLFAIENKMMEVKGFYGYRSELKSQNIPLKLYLISGALKDDFTGRNKELKKVINKRFLVKI